MAVADVYLSWRGFLGSCFTESDVDALSACDVVFFATARGVAQNLVPALMQRNVRIIDISEDFRLRDTDLWEQWYGQTHGCPELVAEAVYGLPETNREQIRSARLVACPGCYPTAAQLALLPWVERNVVDNSSLMINAASGCPGRGRQAKVDNLLTEISDSFKAYAANGHRHLPEIEQGLRERQPESAEPRSEERRGGR